MSGVYTSSGYHNRRSIRLRGYDYSKPGAYFITICIDDYKCRFFGDVSDGLVRLNEFGTIVGQCWNDLAGHYANIRLDEFVIMPNHVHGIIIIREPVHVVTVGAGSSGPVNGPLSNHFGSSGHIVSDVDVNTDNPQCATNNGHDRPGHENCKTGCDDHRNTGRDDRAPTVGNMVAYFKYMSTKRINMVRQTGAQKIWQRNYFDRILRDDKSFFNVRRYIRNNPQNYHTHESHQ